MSTAYWKIEEKGELSADKIASALGSGPFLLLRADVRDGKTLIYFAAEKKDVDSAKLQAKPTEVTLEEVTKL